MIVTELTIDAFLLDVKVKAQIADNGKEKREAERRELG